MKTKKLTELLEAGFRQISRVPCMYAKIEDNKVAVYKLKFSSLKGEVFERYYYGEKKYAEKVLGWDEI